MKFLNSNQTSFTKFIFRDLEESFYSDDRALNDGERVNVVLGAGVSGAEASLAQASTMALSEGFADQILLALVRNPNSKYESMMNTNPNMMVGRDSYEADIKMVDEFEGRIRAVADILAAANIKLGVVGNWMAGAGESHKKDFFGLLSGTMETANDPAYPNLYSHPYQKFQQAVRYVTGASHKRVLEIFTEAGLVDAETQFLSIGYDRTGRLDPDVTVVPDPVMHPLYAPISAGKKILTETEGITNVNMVELKTPSAIFPSFEVKVIGKFFNVLWNNQEAKENPYWQGLFNYIKEHYPQFDRIGEACHNLYQSEEIIAIWNDPTLQYGDKCRALQKYVNDKLGGLDMSTINWLADVCSKHVDKASGKRMIDQAKADKYRGRNEVYLGYGELAGVEIDAESRFAALAASARVKPERLEKNELKTFFKPLSEEIFQVPEGTGIEEGHMAIVRGLDTVRLLGGLKKAGIKYGAKFEGMVRANHQVKIIDGRQGFELKNAVNGNALASITTREIEDYDEKISPRVSRGKLDIDLEKLLIDEYAKTGADRGAVIESRNFLVEERDETTLIEGDKITELIPHRNEFLFAQRCVVETVNDSEKQKTFMFEGEIKLPEGSNTIADLGDGAAQVACLSVAQPGKMTVFRSMQGVQISPEAEKLEAAEGFSDTYTVAGYGVLDKRTGNSNFSVLVKDAQGEIMFKGDKFICQFM